MSPFHVSLAWMIAEAVTVGFAIVYPVVAAIVVSMRLHVSWRYFLYGAVVFFVSQVILRLPWVTLVGAAYGKRITASPALLWGWLTILVVTAALFEEVGRYVGYRVFMRREEKTWNKAVMFGLGHGGLESMLIVGVGGVATLVNVAILSASGPALVPPAQRATVAAQMAALAAQPGWFPLLGAWERLWTVPVHIALAVLVLQVFRRGNIGWLWLAVLGHIVIDGVSVGLAQGLVPRLGTVNGDLVIEGIICVFGLVALAIIWRLRDKPASAPATPLEPPSEVPSLSPL